MCIITTHCIASIIQPSIYSVPCFSALWQQRHHKLHLWVYASPTGPSAVIADIVTMIQIIVWQVPPARGIRHPGCTHTAWHKLLCRLYRKDTVPPKMVMNDRDGSISQFKQTVCKAQANESSASLLSKDSEITQLTLTLPEMSCLCTPATVRPFWSI